NLSKLDYFITRRMRKLLPQLRPYFSTRGYANSKLPRLRSAQVSNHRRHRANLPSDIAENL
ncbi:MAG: hypothetical protein ACYTX0_48980, partial [Nostoc sp.]